MTAYLHKEVKDTRVEALSKGITSIGSLLNVESYIDGF